MYEITFEYAHICDRPYREDKIRRCKFYGEKVVRLATTNDSAYEPPTVMCIETRMHLVPVTTTIHKVDDVATDTTYHDDQTLSKVYDALKSVGLEDEKVIDAVMRMQNAGILFRERERD